MLREEGNIPPVVADEPPYQELIEGYCRFLRRDRGLAETTVVNYRRCLRDFLVSRGDAVSPAELVALSADDLLAFSRQCGAGLGRTAWNHLATALSGFYRWLDLCGHGGAQLVGAVPLRRRYRLADVPCALSWEQVRRLLGTVDLHEPNGRRNYAMLLLIASYGLRGCEVRALRLNDIDWAHDEIVIFAPKTGRRRALPLTRPVGEAVLDYLLAERPPSRHREVFLSSRPPHGPLRSKINPWLGRQLDKAGIVTGHRGAHVLRPGVAIMWMAGLCGRKQHLRWWQSRAGSFRPHNVMVLLAGLVEPFEEILVCCPVGHGLGGERLVGAFDGFAFGFGVGAGVDLGCGHAGVTEQVAYIDQVDSGLEQVHRPCPSDDVRGDVHPGRIAGVAPAQGLDVPGEDFGDAPAG